MTQKLPVSALIIARNEETMISRAVFSCAFAAEIVVVDANSSDRTAELAAKAGAKVVSRAWTGFSDQRNFSLAQAQHDWVFVLDADEAVTPELVKWLHDFFAAGKDKERPYGYRIKRSEFFLGRRIYGACWNPSYQDRFFRKSKAKFVGEIHEYPEIEGGMVDAPESALIEHNHHITVESLLEKMNRYTTLEAFDRYRAGQRTSLLHLFVVFFATWWKNFFYYKGYRDGAYGFVICLLEGVSRTVRHIKLWQIQQLDRTGKLNTLPDPRKQGIELHRKLEAKAER